MKIELEVPDQEAADLLKKLAERLVRSGQACHGLAASTAFDPSKTLPSPILAGDNKLLMKLNW
ncbi:MAG: hypothetical protein HQL44_09880 [Alphaproteobacteria bacterium]|nr:hypothetical protein [Alphaproteobacteria bacterium]CAA6606319.1 hypothetical protein MTBLM1_80235 [Rhodospirillaceae bacterium LM-1]